MAGLRVQSPKGDREGRRERPETETKKTQKTVKALIKMLMERDLETKCLPTQRKRAAAVNTGCPRAPGPASTKTKTSKDGGA